MNRRQWLMRGGSVAGFGLALPPLRAATPGLELPPLPGAVRAPTLPPVQEQRLANDLRLFTVTRGTVPLVQASVWLPCGPERDPADLAGLASLSATLASRGMRWQGRTLGASAVAAEVERLGSELDVQCSPRATVFSLTVTPALLPRALALLAAVVAQPVLAPQELQRERDSRLDALRMTLADPGSVAALAATRAHHVAPWAAQATARSLGAIDANAVRSFVGRHYRPGHAALVLCGAITPQQALALATTAFSPWAGESVADMTPAAAPEPAGPAQVWIDMPEAGQSAVVLALATPPLPVLPGLPGLPGQPSQDALARAVALATNAVLGLNYSSRLSQAIRIRRGLSYGVSSQLSCQPEGCLLLAQAQTQHATAQEVLGLMREELARLSLAPPDAAELAARVAPVMGSLTRRLETVQGLAGAVIGKLAQGRSPHDLALDIPRLLEVSPQQVAEFAASHLPVTAARAVIAGKAPAETPNLLPWTRLKLDLRGLGLATN